MRKYLIIAPVLGVLANCEASTSSTYVTPQGVTYTVDSVSGVDLDKLPQNSDIKMADNNLAKYAETACVLDVPPSTAPDRCDIYVQSDKTGTLVGYAVLTEDKEGVRFQTITTLNEQKQPGGGSCFLDGKIYAKTADYQKVVTDVDGDFDGRIMYSAWEKNPGEFLVSQVGPDDQTSLDSDTALGVWYVSKKGNKFRISQERWNYCYRDSSVYIDDVFFRALSLARVGGKAATRDWQGAKTGTATTNSPPMASAPKQTKWDCSAVYGEKISITLTDSAYTFSPRNPEGGKLSGRLVRKPREKNTNIGGYDTYLTLDGSGTGADAWSMYEGDKGPALYYFSELSGDGSECVEPGQRPKYSAN